MSAPYFAAVGIDPSLTACGVALIQEYDGERVRSVHTFGRKGKATEPLPQRHERINTLVEQILGTIRQLDVTPDLVAIEGPSHGNVTGSHHDRSGLWWQLVIRLREAGCEVVEITPSQVKKYATGKGNAGKPEVMAAAIRRYLDVPISNDNEADAWVLAAMAARLIGEPIEQTLPQVNLETMAKVVRSP